MRTGSKLMTKSLIAKPTASEENAARVQRNCVIDIGKSMLKQTIPAATATPVMPTVDSTHMHRIALLLLDCCTWD